jgi:tetratricopeptide (TPR) repeat protein
MKPTTIQEFRRRYPIRPNDEAFILGSGSYGKVVKVEDQVETEWVAVKISEFKGDDSKSLRAEVELARKIPRHPNIARYDESYRFETDTNVCDFAIMRYYPDGNLAMLMRQVDLTLAQKDDIVRGVLLGLQHLHRQRIVHRDFKPANILISRDNQGRFVPKIADFGLSKLVHEDEIESSDFDLSDGRGTPSYKAPEQIVGGRVSFNLDLWAFGVILFELFTGEKPFAASQKSGSEHVLKREIEKKIVNVALPESIRQIPEPYQTLVRRCLVKDVRKRVRKEDELLDLLDGIPTLLNEARQAMEAGDFAEAIARYEAVLARRENHPRATEGLKTARERATKQSDDAEKAERQRELYARLTEADGYFARRDYANAKTAYEAVLALDGQYAAARVRLAQCAAALTPPPLLVAKPTGVTAPVEYTDLFVPESVRPTEPPKPKRQSPAPALVRQPPQPEKAVPVVERPVSAPPRPRFSVRPVYGWMLGVALVVLVGGYFWTSSQQPPTTPEEASVIGGSPSKSVTRTVATPGSTPSKSTGGESTPTAETAVRQAQYKRLVQQAVAALNANDAATAKELTGKAYALDPAGRELKKLRAGLRVLEERASTQQTREAETDTRQATQTQYESLIAKGVEAIESGNKKTEAIGYFHQAQQLAQANGLSTTKAAEQYANYIAKGDRIFQRGDQEGAKAWYLVAQALSNSDEIRRKIRECNN